INALPVKRFHCAEGLSAQSADLAPEGLARLECRGRRRYSCIAQASRIHLRNVAAHAHTLPPDGQSQERAPHQTWTRRQGRAAEAGLSDQSVTGLVAHVSLLGLLKRM